MKRHKLSDLKDLSEHELANLVDESVRSPGPTNAVHSLDTLYHYEREAGLPDKSKLDLRVRWINALRDVVSLRCPKNKCGAPMVSDVDVCLASPRERTIALILTLPKT